MKQLVKFKKKIFIKQKIVPFGPKYTISNDLSSFYKLLKELKLIQNNFGDYKSREVELIHFKLLPPKSSRCITSIIQLNKQMTYSTTYFKNFETDNPTLITLINVPNDSIQDAIRNLENIITFLKNIILNYKNLNILNKIKKDLDDTILKAMDSIIISKSKLMSFIFSIQNNFRSFMLPKTVSPLVGDLILSFSSQKTKKEFIVKNNIVNSKYILDDKNLAIHSSKVLDATNVIRSEINVKIDIHENHFKPSNLFDIENLPKNNSNAPYIGILDGAISRTSPLFNNIKVTSFLNEAEIKSFHGESVASIAYAGPLMNGYDDGCDDLNIHLFEIFSPEISTWDLLPRIKQAITSSPQIKVWNLSINAMEEIAADQGVISWMAMELDKIQEENNVIIVQSAGNKNQEYLNNKITVPADAINSLTISATNSYDSQIRASYALEGYGEFFTRKPDLSFFGGDQKNKLVVIYNGQICQNMGTSFAAPFVARQLGHLIYYEKFSILEAKALLIHSATKKADLQSCYNKFIGWGVLPKTINETLTTQDNEIRIILGDKINATKTLFSEFYIPFDNNKQNYSIYFTSVSKAKLDSKFGAEYVRANVVSKFMPMKKDGTFHTARAITPFITHEGEPIAREKELIKFYGKWKTTISTKDLVQKVRDATNYESYAIKTKIDKRLSIIQESFDLEFVNVITLVNIKNNDNFEEFLELNKINIENINEISNEQNIFLEGEINWK